MATTTSTSALLDQTLAALQGDITSSTGGTSTIASWISALQGQQGLEDITDELQNLQQALSSGTPDADAIADSLSNLGELTSSAAVSASADTQAKLQQLGDALSSAAEQV
ncbi:hypothetical protein HHL22_13070 [Hymenobacter sp. RP-2-7]|uniref:Uncharacterized protein n=1 Tax=Hymenobacter polaris TaxID=2682546 RepID=A0A7Y0AFD0_9BACT|nr:hypothetical protein [Hymenobacter polaris]NML66137.1 hypothetical protein [Hymenobacter polaris]